MKPYQPRPKQQVFDPHLTKVYLRWTINQPIALPHRLNDPGHSQKLLKNTAGLIRPRDIPLQLSHKTLTLSISQAPKDDYHEFDPREIDSLVAAVEKAFGRPFTYLEYQNISFVLTSQRQFDGKPNLLSPYGFGKKMLHEGDGIFRYPDTTKLQFLCYRLVGHDVDVNNFISVPLVALGERASNELVSGLDQQLSQPLVTPLSAIDMPASIELLQQATASFNKTNEFSKDFRKTTSYHSPLDKMNALAWRSGAVTKSEDQTSSGSAKDIPIVIGAHRALQEFKSASKEGPWLFANDGKDFTAEQLAQMNSIAKTVSKQSASQLAKLPPADTTLPILRSASSIVNNPFDQSGGKIDH